jgi:amphi-Trp domain-containing protein
MADKTHHEQTLSRSDAGAYVRSLGSTLAEEAGSWTVPVGNKDVEVRPDSKINVETTVDERSRLLGDDITEVIIKLRWKESDESNTGGEQGR